MININFIIICIIILIYKIFEFLFNRFGNNNLNKKNKLQNNDKLGGKIYKNKDKCVILINIIISLIKNSSVNFYVKIGNYYIFVINGFYISNKDFDEFTKNFTYGFREINKTYFLETEKKEYTRDAEIKKNENINIDEFKTNIDDFMKKIVHNLSILPPTPKNNNDQDELNRNKIINLNGKKVDCVFYDISNFIKNNNYDKNIIDINNLNLNIDYINNNMENIKLILYDIVIYELIDRNVLLQNTINNEMVNYFKLLNIDDNIFKYKILNIKSFVKIIKNSPINETKQNDVNKQLLYSHIISNNDNISNNDINILIPYKNNDRMQRYKNNLLDTNNINLNNGNNYYLFNDITTDEFKIENQNSKYISELKLEDKIKIVSKKYFELKGYIYNLLTIIINYYEEYALFNYRISRFFNKYKNNNIIDNNNNKLTIFDKINCYKFYFDNIDKTKEENKEIIDSFQDIEQKINNSPIYIYLFDFVWINIQNYLDNKIDLVVDLFEEDFKLNNGNNFEFINNKIEFINIKSNIISDFKEEENIPDDILLNHFNNNVFLQNSVNPNKEFIIISFIVPGHATIILIQQKSDHFNILFFNPHSSFDTKVDETNIYLKYFNVFLKIFKIKNTKPVNVINYNYVCYKNLQSLFERPEFSAGMCLLTSYLFTYFMLHMFLLVGINENNISMINKYIYWYIKNQLFKCDFNYEKSLNIENVIDEEKKQLDEEKEFDNYFNLIFLTDQQYKSYEKFIKLGDNAMINPKLSFLNYTEKLRCKYNYAVNTKKLNEIEQIKISFNSINYILNFGLLLIKKYIHKEMIIAETAYLTNEIRNRIVVKTESTISKYEFINFYNKKLDNTNYLDFHLGKIIMKNNNEKKILFPTINKIIEFYSIKKYNKKLDILNNWRNWDAYHIFTWLYYIVFKVFTLNNTADNTADIKNLFNFILEFSKQFSDKNLNLENIFSNLNLNFDLDKKYLDIFQTYLLSLNNYNLDGWINFINNHNNKLNSN